MSAKAKKLEEVIDELANRLLERITPKEGEESTITIEQQLNVFKEFTRWAQIRNKISPDGDEGGKIDDYRKRLDRNAGGNRNPGGADALADGEGTEEDDEEPSDLNTAKYHPHTGARKKPSAIGGGIQSFIDRKPKPHDNGNGHAHDGDLPEHGTRAGSPLPPAVGNGGDVLPGNDGGTDA